MTLMHWIWWAFNRFYLQLRAESSLGHMKETTEQPFVSDIDECILRDNRGTWSHRPMSLSRNLRHITTQYTKENYAVFLFGFFWIHNGNITSRDVFCATYRCSNRRIKIAAFVSRHEFDLKKQLPKNLGIRPYEHRLRIAAMRAFIFFTYWKDSTKVIGPMNAKECLRRERWSEIHTWNSSQMNRHTMRINLRSEGTRSWKKIEVL